MRTHPLVRAALLAVAAALLAGCGLPDDRRPRVIAAEEAPIDLNEVPSNATTASPGGDDEVEIYLVRNGLLAPVTRAADGTDLETVVGLLLQGPTEDEEGRGFLTVIPAETQLLGATVDRGTATIDLGCAEELPEAECGILRTQGPDVLTTFAQLTCSAIEVRGIEGVRFLQEGSPLAVSTSERGTVEAPEVVTCDDFRGLLS